MQDPQKKKQAGERKNHNRGDVYTFYISRVGKYLSFGTISQCSQKNISRQFVFFFKHQNQEATEIAKRKLRKLSMRAHN